MMGFQGSAMKFAHFFFLCEAVVFAGTSLLIFCGCCARDFEMANNYATVFFCRCRRPVDSWPSHEVVGGLFFEFEAVHDAPRRPIYDVRRPLHQ